MKPVKVAIPVFKNRSKIHFDKGRHWSIIEHFLLEFIAKKSSTVADLELLCSIHRTVIIESLSRLMRAGWVEIVFEKAEVLFGATGAGKVAADMSDLPSSVRRMDRNINFIIDETYASVFKSHEVQFYDFAKIKDVKSLVKLNTNTTATNTNMEEIADLFLSDDEKFVRIDQIIGRPFRGYAVFTVLSGRIENPPKGMSTLLEKNIIEAAKSFQKDVTVTVTPNASQTFINMNTEFGDLHPVAFHRDDLLLGAEQHENHLVGFLKTARSRIFIHSTFIRLESFLNLIDSIKTAVNRGVKIYIFWGQEETEDSTTLSAINQIRESIREHHLDHFVSISPRSTTSHAKIIVADAGSDGRYISIIGSCNWLSSPFKSYEASIKVRDASANVRIMRIFLRLAQQQQGALYSNALLTALKEIQEHQISEVHSKKSGEISLIIGSGHNDLVIHIRDTLQRQLLITSNRLSSAADPTILAPVISALRSRPHVSAQLLYGRVSGGFSNKDGKSKKEELLEHGVELKAVKKPGMHAKIIAWDSDNIVITSLNWLSTTETDANSLHEIGVRIVYPGIADHVLKEIEKISPIN